MKNQIRMALIFMFCTVAGSCLFAAAGGAVVQASDFPQLPFYIKGTNGLDPQLSPEQAVTFCRDLEAKCRDFDFKYLEETINYDEMSARSVEGLNMPEATKNAYLKGLAKGRANGNLGKTMAAEKTVYHFMRLRKQKGVLTTLFRATSSGGVNYHEMILKHDSTGRIRIVDVYPYASGEWLVESFRRGAVILEATAGGSKNKGTVEQREFLESGTKLQAIAQAVRSGDAALAKKTYDSLPLSMQFMKLTMVMRIMYSSKISDGQYVIAMKEFQRLFPKDPAVDLMSIDYFLLKERYQEAHACIQRIDERVGGDPYLDFLRGNIFMTAGDMEKAKACHKKAIELEPMLEDAYWGLITCSLKEKNFKDTARLLDLIEKQLQFTVGDVEKIELYNDFVKSPEYAEWMKPRKKATPAPSQPEKQ